jgi:TP901 family phage tail tape measure protein
MPRDNILKVLIQADDQTARGFKDATAAVGVFSAAINAALGVATKQAADFEKGMAEINTLLGKGATPAIREMSKEMLALSRSSGEALGSLTKARYDIISAGFSGAAESAQVMNASLTVAKAGLVEVDVAADLVTTTLNGLGLEADESGRVIDALFSTVQLGKTTMTQLAASMGPVFANARIANISLEEVGAAMAQITAAGIDTTEASTALSNLMRSLAAPSKDAAAALDEAGISLDEGLGPALAALGTAGEDGLEALARLIPNIRALKAAAAASDIDVFNANLDKINSNMGVASEAASIMQDTVTHQFELLKREVQALSTEIGQALLPAFRTLLSLLRGISKVFSDMPELVKITFASLAAGLAVTTALATAMGGLAIAVHSANTALTAIGVTLATISKISIIGAAIGAVVGAGVGIKALVDDAKAKGGGESQRYRGLGAPTSRAGARSRDIALDFLSGGSPTGGAGGGAGGGGVVVEADKLAEALALVAERTESARFQFMEMTGDVPSDLQLLHMALIDVGASVEDIETVSLAAVRGISDVVPQTIEQFSGDIDDAITDGIGEMPDHIATRAPEVRSVFAVLFEEIGMDLKDTLGFALEDTFRVFGDAIAAVAIDGQKFSKVFSDGFKQVKRAVIGTMAELIAMRAVMAGLKALSSIGGPLGFLAGLFLNTGTSFAPSFSPLKANVGFGSVPGTPGLDVTPALLSGGETVLTREQSRLMRRALSVPGDNFSGDARMKWATRDEREAAVAIDVSDRFSVFGAITMIDTIDDARVEAGGLL